MKEKVNDELKQHFRPEFLNRIDDIIVFHAADAGRDHRRSSTCMITRVDDAAARTRTSASSSPPAAKTLLAKKGYDPALGARPLRRTIQREIEDPLSEKILFGELRPGQIVVVDAEGDPDNIEKSKLVFRGADKPGTVPDAVPAELTVRAPPTRPVRSTPPRPIRPRWTSSREGGAGRCWPVPPGASQANGRVRRHGRSVVTGLRRPPAEPRRRAPDRRSAARSGSSGRRRWCPVGPRAAGRGSGPGYPGHARRRPPPGRRRGCGEPRPAVGRPRTARRRHHRRASSRPGRRCRVGRPPRAASCDARSRR